MRHILTQYQRDQLAEKLADEAAIAALYGAEAEVYPRSPDEWWCEHCGQYGYCPVCGQTHE